MSPAVLEEPCVAADFFPVKVTLRPTTACLFHLICVNSSGCTAHLSVTYPGVGERPSVNLGAPIDNPGVLSLGLSKYVMGIHFSILAMLRGEIKFWQGMLFLRRSPI